MISSRILAHRGHWFGGENLPTLEKNSLEACERAARFGFGLETDVRDHDGEIVISHDIPIGRQLKLETILELDWRGPLALNIKSDGLSAPLEKLLAGSLSKADVFFFDMSVPETRSYAKMGLPFANRRSEYEFLDIAQGSTVWLDAFETEWYLEGPKRELWATTTTPTVVVSPELHGRTTSDSWPGICQLMRANSNIKICTDYPVEFRDLYRGLKNRGN